MITAEQIHNELWDLGLNRLADLKSTVVDNKAIETKRNLESLGFTQSETYKNLSKKVKKMEEKVVYDFFNQRFDGVVFVPTNDSTFENINAEEWVKQYHELNYDLEITETELKVARSTHKELFGGEEEEAEDSF